MLFAKIRTVSSVKKLTKLKELQDQLSDQPQLKDQPKLQPRHQLKSQPRNLLPNQQSPQPPKRLQLSISQMFLTSMLSLAEFSRHSVVINKHTLKVFFATVITPRTMTISQLISTAHVQSKLAKSTRLLSSRSTILETKLKKKPKNCSILTINSAQSNGNSPANTFHIGMSIFRPLVPWLMVCKMSRPHGRTRSSDNWRQRAASALTL